MFNLDDPKVQALLMAAGGLLTPTRARGGAAVAEGVSRGIQGGLLGYQQGVQMRDRSAQRDMQRRMQEAQLSEFQRGQDFNKALSSGYSPGVTPSTPVDDNGFPMPRSGPQMDFSGAMKIDPLKAMQAQAAWQQMNAKAGPQFKEVGGRLVKIDGDQVKEAYAPPAKPVFQPGQTREIKSGRTVITQEWDGSGWKQIAKSAMDKPETDTGPKAPPGYRWAGDRLEPIPGGPQDPRTIAKVDSTAIGKSEAKQRVDKMLDQIEASYAELSKLGGAISTAQPARQNIQNRLASSDTGQLIGSALGTQEQSIRNSIRQSIPLLMNEIRSATGMSAKAMDSNAELQFYLRAATDPTMDVEANLRAIKALRETYGTGAAQPASSGPSQAPKPGEVVDGYYFKGGDPADPKNWAKR